MTHITDCTVVTDKIDATVHKQYKKNGLLDLATNQVDCAMYSNQSFHYKVTYNIPELLLENHLL